MEIKTLKIGDIHPYEKNPRKNDKSVAAVARSIEEFGWQQPIVVDVNHEIICGHTRYKAAKKLGMKEVPCLRELCVGKRIDIWNGNTKTDTVYDRTKDKMRPYVKAEKDYIRKKQEAQTLRNARRKRA